MVLSVLMRIHWGRGRFWRAFFASLTLVLKVLCDGYEIRVRIDEATGIKGRFTHHGGQE
jgi:hypothetical protein